MTTLSRSTKLGLAPEATQGIYVVPAVSVPFNTAKYVNEITPNRDESVRANDAVLQGLVQGPWITTWDLDVNFYSDLAGHLLRGMIGPDTVTPGVSTTLAANCLAGATSIQLTASVPANSIIQISDAAGANTEWVQIGTVTGSGPYTAAITTPASGTRYAHTATGGSVLSQATHVFKQNRVAGVPWKSYSFTTDDGIEQLGWPGCVMSELAIKIDPAGLITFAPKYTGWPSAPQSTFSYAPSTVQPSPGWGWTVTNGGASSTRGLTFDLTLKRAIEAIHASNGSQGPREVFPGALESDGTYKAIFENTSDVDLFRQYLQMPTVHTVTKPVAIGGESIAITMSSSGYTTAERDLASQYIQLTQSLSGIANVTDAAAGGVVQVTLKNYVQTAY
jgi:hypothetical protein